MTTIDSYAPGQFCWVDLTAKDITSATAFYEGLFGWQQSLQPSHGGPPYGQFRKDGVPVAGIGQMSEQMLAAGVPSVWNSYVSVEDCAASQARAVQLGAEVIFETMQVPDAGTLCFLKDPGGAAFAMWQPGLHCGSGRMHAPGAPTNFELATRDIEAAQGFYGALFGWSFADPFAGADSPSPTPVRTICAAGHPNGQMLQMTEAWGDMPAHWGVYFAVEDTDASAAKAEPLGGKVCVPPTDIPAGRFSVLEDRGGAYVSIIRPAG